MVGYIKFPPYSNREQENNARSASIPFLSYEEGIIPEALEFLTSWYDIPFQAEVGTTHLTTTEPGLNLWNTCYEILKIYLK